MTLTGKDRTEDWIESIFFADDKFFTAERRAGLSTKGGFDPVIKMEKSAGGIWRGIRDIRL
jgi:hypothetical protein